MTPDRTTFAFRLARRVETRTDSRRQARNGPPIAGCYGMPLGDYRTGNTFNPDSGFLC